MEGILIWVGLVVGWAMAGLFFHTGRQWGNVPPPKRFSKGVYAAFICSVFCLGVTNPKFGNVLIKIFGAEVKLNAINEKLRIREESIAVLDDKLREIEERHLNRAIATAEDKERQRKVITSAIESGNLKPMKGIFLPLSAIKADVTKAMNAEGVDFDPTNEGRAWGYIDTSNGGTITLYGLNRKTYPAKLHISASSMATIEAEAKSNPNIGAIFVPASGK